MNFTFEFQILLTPWRIEFLIAYQYNSLWSKILLLLAWDIPRYYFQGFLIVPQGGCYFPSPRLLGITYISNLVLYWVGNNILAGLYLIQFWINLYWIPTPSHFQSKFTVATYEKKQNISQVHNLKYRKYYLTTYLKICGSISFEMLLILSRL